ncbi:hypothetical protein PYW07_009974 [Mythimna separata]|uniref:Uncharacterized protein n=1 Tax=Mythimna separata TaxID=271217 RepID=A0AAD7YHB0_MYTSE|nr:hypothetical protein PYW07_009974 [Mythimna separata]
MFKLGSPKGSPTTVKDTKNDGGLFLLEVLIDKVTFEKSPCFSDKDFRTCVTIAAPAVQTLEICDDEPGASVAKSGGPFVKTFNSGKSCMFSLPDAEITKAMSNFPIQVTVYKSLACGCLPTKIIMGMATIDMTKEFVASRNKYMADPGGDNCQALKDTFQIVGADGADGVERVGDIVMFLRITCFGKLIVTKFKGAGQPNLGGARVSSIVDRSCNPRRDFQTPKDPCVCGAAHVPGSGKGKHGTGAPCQHGRSHGGGPCPITPDPYNSTPCQVPDDTCYCAGPKPPAKLPMVCKHMEQHNMPKDCCPPGNKVIFQMPSDSCTMNHKQRAHFHLTSEGVGDVAREEPGQLVAPTAEDYSGVVYDYSRQVIKLRIGKVVEMPGRKTKFEYQFVTPAPARQKVVPVKDTRTAQCLPTCPDCCPSKSRSRKLK